MSVYWTVISDIIFECSELISNGVLLRGVGIGNIEIDTLDLGLQIIPEDTSLKPEWKD